MSEHVLAYITTKNKSEAKRVGKALVREKLAACVNILSGMESIYNWQGKMATTCECILIAKTRASLANKLTARVKKLHSYSCPCVLILPVVSGCANFLKWIDDGTGA